MTTPPLLQPKSRYAVAWLAVRVEPELLASRSVRVVLDSDGWAVHASKMTLSLTSKRPRNPDFLRRFVHDLYGDRCLRCGVDRPLVMAHLAPWPVVRSDVLRSPGADPAGTAFWRFHQPANVVLLVERGNDRTNGMHALRHFYASSLLDAGESIRAVSEYLGHASAAFTLRTYTHLMPASQDRTRGAIDGLLGGARPDDGLAADAGAETPGQDR